VSVCIVDDNAVSLAVLERLVKRAGASSVHAFTDPDKGGGLVPAGRSQDRAARLQHAGNGRTDGHGRVAAIAFNIVSRHRHDLGLGGRVAAHEGAVAGRCRCHREAL